MDEYIKREDAIKHLRGACIAKYPLSFSYGIFASADEISKLPTADVVPKSEYDAVVSAVDNSTREFLKLHDDYQRQLEKNQKLHSQMAKYQLELQNSKSEVDRLNAVMKEMDEQRAYTINMLGESLEKAKSEVEKLELTLQGVMWSVDKWLDEADYDADQIKRAITMREKTLQIVENAKAEVAREIFAEIDKLFVVNGAESVSILDYRFHKGIAELKKKYTEGET